MAYLENLRAHNTCPYTQCVRYRYINPRHLTKCVMIASAGPMNEEKVAYLESMRSHDTIMYTYKHTVVTLKTTSTQICRADE